MRRRCKRKKKRNKNSYTGKPPGAADDINVSDYCAARPEPTRWSPEGESAEVYRGISGRLGLCNHVGTSGVLYGGESKH